MVMAMAGGLDAAIVNPLDGKMMANIIAADALLGKDEYCMSYLNAYRANKLEF
jgi:5-methyltetrahydrofolate--homocysteine methyltransferase